MPWRCETLRSRFAVSVSLGWIMSWRDRVARWLREQRTEPATRIACHFVGRKYGGTVVRSASVMIRQIRLGIIALEHLTRACTIL